MTSLGEGETSLLFSESQISFHLHFFMPYFGPKIFKNSSKLAAFLKNNKECVRALPGRGRHALVPGSLTLSHLVHPGAAVEAVSSAHQAGAGFHSGRHREPWSGGGATGHHRRRSHRSPREGADAAGFTKLTVPLSWSTFVSHVHVNLGSCVPLSEADSLQVALHGFLDHIIQGLLLCTQSISNITEEHSSQ